MPSETHLSAKAPSFFFSLTLLGILLIAANLRAPITALGPVLDEIAQFYHLSSVLTGSLNALPLLIFALGSPLAPWITRKVSLERALLTALCLIFVGCLLRSCLGYSGLWIGTILIGGGIAMANVLVVPFVKREFPHHTALCVGLYAATMALMAATSSGVSAPLSAISSSGWKMSLGIWSVLALVAIIVWYAVCRKTSSNAALTTGHASSQYPSIWRSPLAWHISMFMALQSMVFYTLIDWYPLMASDNGFNAATSGVHLFFYQAIAVIANILTSLVIRRTKDQRVIGLMSAIFIVVGIAGLLCLPELSICWLLSAGIGAGMSMVICLTLFGLRARDHHQTGRLSGKAQCIGYLLGAMGPYCAGVLHDIWQTWNAPLLGLLLIAMLQGYFAWQSGKNRYV